MRTTRQKFNLILTLAVMLTMAQTVWAAKETRKVTFYMDGCTSGRTTLQDDHTLVSGGMVLHYSNKTPDLDKIQLTTNGGRKITTFRRSVIQCEGVIEFTNLEGTVKSVELTNFAFNNSGMQMYIGLDKNNTSTLLHLHGDNSDYDFPSNDSNKPTNSATFEGSIDVSATNPLRIMFSGIEGTSGNFAFSDGTIVITYEIEVQETQDPGHTFSFSNTDNTLTATCTSTSAAHNCGLTERKSTLTLTANDASFDSQRHNASLNLTDFMNETGITDITASFVYRNRATSEESNMAPSAIGDYTVTATITISGTSYTLTKDFSILAGYKVNNIYSQLSLSKSSALEGEAVTITYTQQMGESLDGLTLTGATSGNNIAYTQSGNTYTFNMPTEDVNLSATFTYPLNENDFTQSGDTYTIKTAEGWNYFCRRLEVDGELNGFSGKTVVLAGNITVTTMAGSTDHPFKGTFDGDGHTLTFNYTADRTNCAPFRITDGATIRNLHATGQIEGGAQHYLSGLVGSASGKLTIENCRVSTQISSTVSGIANNGGFVGYLSSQYNQCHITGCVFDGLIYNPDYAGTTYGCGGFIGAMAQYGYAILKDCLFLHGKYDNNGGKCELKWGNNNDQNSTFFHRSNSYGEGKLTNCFYVGTRGLKQGSPAVESADAPDNFAHFGTPTDHGFLKVYGHTMVFDGKYYTPTYGDLVETYSYSGEKSYIIEYDDMPLGIKDVKTKQRTNYLRYNRQFTKDKAVTIMLPFDFTKNDIRRGEYDNISEGKFYEFAGIEEVPCNFWIAVMKEVGVEGSNETTETTMKANTPYLFMPGEDAKYLYFTNGDDYYQGFDIFTEGYERGNKQTEYDGSDGTYSWNKWNFKGTYQPRYWSDSENSEEIGKVYGFAGATKEVDEQLVVAGDFVRAKSDAMIRPTLCYLMWAGEGTGQGTGSNNDLVLTLPEHFKILSVDGQPYTGNGQDLSKGSTIVIELEAGYSATNVEATEQSNGNRSTPPEEIPDYDDYIE